MFKTIKAKIIFMTLSMLIILGLVAFMLTWGSFTNSKKLKTESCNLMIAYFVEQVNKSIQQLQGNVIDLSLMGEVFYRSDNKDHSLLDFIVIHNFENNMLAVGGGIWFEPYKILPAQKRFCSYAYHTPKGVIIDKSFEGEKYDYFNQSWYLEINDEVDKNLSTSYGQKFHDFTEIMEHKRTQNKKHAEISRLNTLQHTVVWTQPYYDGTGTHSLMTTVGAAIYDKNHNFVGMSTVDWELDSIIAKISEIRPTPNSFALFADKDNDFILVVTDKKEQEQNKNSTGKSLKSLPWYKENAKNGEMFIFNNIKYISFIEKLDNGMILIVNVPVDELFSALIKRLKYMLLALFIFCVSISSVTYYLIKKNINEPVDYLINTAKKIGEGNLDIKMDIKDPEEFATLASTFNKMTTDIKEYITNLSLAQAEKEYMQTELNIAKSIQNSALPNVFPPYPERREFDIFAKMYTAKEVGGDFYDFFFIDNDHLVFLIADVSGKGIPAALFMMTTKTLIKNIAKTGLSADELMTTANRQICKTNEQGFFVTVFLSILELSTGKMSCVNAGHNPPLIKNESGGFEYFKCDPNLVMGAMDNTVYKACEVQLKPGAYVFFYTDGVTEAYSEKQEFYGEGRLSDTLNNTKDKEIEDILLTVKTDVENFTQDQEQADDMTMLVLKYNGAKEKAMVEKTKTKTKTFLLPADINRINTVIKWLEENCEEAKIPDEYKRKLNLAVEEIFINISTYAYPPKEGDVEITFKVIEGKQVQLKFTDSGTPYNPLEKQDPDITLSADERPVGGLGIFLVKNTMDLMEYEFKNNKNILTLQMTFKKD